MTHIMKYPADAALFASIPAAVEFGLKLPCTSVHRLEGSDLWVKSAGSPPAKAAELGIAVESNSQEPPASLVEYAARAGYTVVPASPDVTGHRFTIDG